MAQILFLGHRKPDESYAIKTQSGLTRVILRRLRAAKPLQGAAHGIRLIGIHKEAQDDGQDGSYVFLYPGGLAED